MSIIPMENADSSIDLNVTFYEFLNSAFNGDKPSSEFIKKASKRITYKMNQDKLVIKGDPSTVLVSINNFADTLIPTYKSLMGKEAYFSLYGTNGLVTSYEELEEKLEKQGYLEGPEAMVLCLKKAVRDTFESLNSGQGLNGNFDKLIKSYMTPVCSFFINNFRQIGQLRNSDLTDQEALEVGLAYVGNW